MLWADRPSLAVRRVCLGLYWAVIYTLTHVPDIDRLAPIDLWLFSDFDKVVHAGMYAGWAGMWWWLLSHGGRRVSRPAMNWILLGGAVYGIFDELTQGIVGRTPDVLDFACDLAALMLVSAVLAAWQNRRWAQSAQAVTRKPRLRAES